MRKLQVLGVALIAVFAFGVIAVESASAAPTFLLALWLVNKEELLAELLVEVDGELELEDIKVPLVGNAGVLCSGILDGWVGPNSLDYISEVLTLGGGAVNTKALTAPGLKCTNLLNCAEPSTVWAINLGWETEVELMEDEGSIFFANLLTTTNGTKNVGWEVECSGLTDTCEAPEGVAQITLNAGGTAVLGTFSEAFTLLAGAKIGTCSLGGAESGEVRGTGEFLPDAGELSASSETSEA